MAQSSPLDGVLDPRGSRRNSGNDLDLWLTLNRRLALDPRAARTLLDQGGSVDEALRLLGVDTLGHDPERERARAAMAGCGAVAVPIASRAYPSRLTALSDPPPLLFVRGDVSALGAPAVAIVGARAATAYGLDVARRFASELARAGCVVVSGLAWGIDAAAHRAALEADGRTVAVQACGIDRVYPAPHRRLADQIVDAGAVISEFPPGLRPRKPFFPLRNRLISGLSQAVIVVEARERSGSLITARHAAAQGVEVFAVPGPIHAPTSAGTHRLLREGAWLAAEPGDILSALGCTAASPVERAMRSLGARERAVLAALEQRPATREELARALDCSPHDLSLVVLELELDGRVTEDRDGRLWASGKGD
ncbi:DNA-processing protein DprA [Myxococcota bacterium]|nr:DNA-processing protein DprA [Myxococcota bacterium]